MPAPRPNILFIQDDQHHAGLLSAAGHPDVRTPHIDRIAAAGVRFTEAFCPSAICQVSRVSMFTGQSAHTTGDYENSGLVAPDLYSLVEHLRRGGYRTGMAGKTHFVPQWPAHGFEERHAGDFCDCISSPEENEHYVRVREAGMGEHYDLCEAAMRLGEIGSCPSRLPLELTQEWWLADATLDFLKRQTPGRPFFFFASFSRPHNPWMPSAPFHAMYDPEKLALPPTHPDDWKAKPFRERDRWHDPRCVFHYPSMTEPKLRRALALYYGLVSQIDSQIGRMLDGLRELGLAGNTIVVFCSDHGDFAGEHGIVDKGVPTLDGIWRVPLLLSDPRGDFPRGAVRSQLVNLIDVMPTLFERIGLELPRRVEGRSLMREIREPQWPGRGAEFYEFRHVKTVRTREHILSYYSPGDPEARDYAHTSCWARGGELYDLKKDPNQFHNVFDDPAYREVRLELTELLLEWFCRTERVHRLEVTPVQTPPNCKPDFGGRTAEEWRQHYLKGHPLINEARVK